MILEIPRLTFKHQDAMTENRIDSPITFTCIFDAFLLSISANKLNIRRSLLDAKSLSPPATKTGISIEIFYLVQQVRFPKIGDRQNRFRACQRQIGYWCQLAETQIDESPRERVDRKLTLKENNVDAKTLTMPDTTYIQFFFMLFCNLDL